MLYLRLMKLNKDRLFDLCLSDSSEDTEKIEEEEGTLLLDEKLRDYIIQHREAPAIINKCFLMNTTRKKDGMLRVLSI